MNLDLIVGLLVTAVPLLAIGYFMLAKQPGIFRMFVAMILIGLGYLTATGAISDIGSKVTGNHVAAVPADTPAAPAAPAPAM